MKLDSTDHDIISELRANSRFSIRDVAKKIGSRPSTVHQRIQKLIKQGVIEKFTLKLNNKLVGENFIVFMLVAAPKHIDEKAFADKHIKEVFGVTGEYDLLIKMKFEDVDSFNDFVLKFRKEHGLKQTLTMVATVNIKEEI